MSLFGGIFQLSGSSSGGLFSDASQYKAHSSTDRPVEQPPQQPDPEQPKKKRKHDTSTDTGLEKVDTGTAAAQAAVKAATSSRKHDNQHKQTKGADDAITSQQAHKKASKQHVVTPVTVQSPGEAAVKQLPEQQVHLQQIDKQLNKQKRKTQLDKQHTGQADEAVARSGKTAGIRGQPQAKVLRRQFAEYGHVDSVRLRSVPLDLESKKKLPRKAAVIKGSVSADRGGAKAYVVFKDAAAAEAALAANMTQLEGHHIRVDHAAPPSAAAAAAAAGGGGDAGSGRGGGSEGVGGVLYDPVRSVFVGNLDWQISEEELIRVFSDGVRQPELAGSVEAVRVVRDSHTNLGKGIAYVLFTTKAAARAALQLDGHKLGKRAMRVSRVSRKALATGAGSGKKMGVKPSGARPGSGSGDVANKKSSSKGKAGKAKSKGGKRPAVAARKAAQKAAAMRKKRS
eukprot:gene3945-4199_t